jgi:hypothetical protein
VRHEQNAAASERLRDHAYRWVTLLLARLLYPAAMLVTFGRDGRRQASEWALTLRFPPND